MAGTEPLVVSEVDGDGVAVLALNRPDRHNAWSLEVERAYHAELGRLDSDAAVRAIVVTGRGDSFCPGSDPSALATLSGRPMDLTGRVSPGRVWELRKPLIAAINGACAGVGLLQALMCDVRFAAPAVRFTTAYARRGLPAEYGIAWLLPRIVGAGHALDLLLSGRVFTAAEAQAMGMLSGVGEDVLGLATSYARVLARDCSPASLALMRHQVYAGLDSDYPTALEGSYRAMRTMVGEADFAEGVSSYLERRPARFGAATAALVPSRISGVTPVCTDFVPEQLDRGSTEQGS